MIALKCLSFRQIYHIDDLINNILSCNQDHSHLQKKTSWDKEAFFSILLKYDEEIQNWVLLISSLLESSWKYYLKSSLKETMS